jgi:hypothetical protein
MTVTAVDITARRIELPAGQLADGSPVWVEARPNLRRSYALAGDILTALGKRRDLAGKGRNQHEDITLATIWLRAHRARDLVITDAQRLHPKILGTFCRLAVDAEVHLWLLHRPPTSDAFLHALDRRTDATTGLADVPLPLIVATTPVAVSPYPPVPRHDFHLFRAVCDSDLPGDDRTRVLTDLDDAAARAYQHLAEHGADAAAVADLVDEILTDAPDDNRLITEIRALQLAAWHHDLFVAVDLDTLLNSEERPTLSLGDVDDALAVYRQPHRILACALTRRGHPIDDITELRLGDVQDDGRLCTVGGRHAELPASIARAAYAALLLRQHVGADDTDSLIPYSAQTLAATLTDATNDIGIHVKGRRAERTRPKRTAYLRRLGITIARLP